MKNKKTYSPLETRTDVEQVPNYIMELASAMKISCQDLGLRLTKEAKRLYLPFSERELWTKQVLLNCIPRRFKMHKVPEFAPISVNSLVNLFPKHTFIILTRDSHDNDRFLFAKDGAFYDTLDSSRLFVDIFWVLSGGKLILKQPNAPKI